MLFFVRRAVTLALVACVAYPCVQAYGQNFAQQPGFQDGRDLGRRDTDRRDHDRFLHGSAILGSQVFLQGGIVAGTIRDFVISENGYVEYAVVETSDGFIAIPWNAGTFDVGRRGLIVDFSRDRFRELHHFRNISELRDARLQQHIQTFFRGNRPGNFPQRDINNRQPNNQQNGLNNRGTAPNTPAATNPGTRANGNRGTAPGTTQRNTAGANGGNGR
jgi:hypothetical protein